MIQILGYGCSSAAGRGIEAFWKGLAGGVVHSRPFRARDAQGLAYAFPSREESSSALDRLAMELCHAADEAGVQRSPREPLGVILASSKGCLEDFVWQERATALDPLSPVLGEFLRRSGLTAARQICVTNACASSVAALFLARQWIESQAVSHVLVLAADTLGAFVMKGFGSLKALTPTSVRPFSADRDGLLLGEAAAAIVLSARAEGEPALAVLSGVGIDTEGFAATRPSSAGESLKRAVAKAMARGAAGRGSVAPDIIVAHGTATPANDSVEDLALGALDPELDVPITATKWSIGHALGASGLMDVIAGCEMIRRGERFRIASTREVDPKFRGRYLHANATLEEGAVTDVLVSSLGFGGVHGAARVSAVGSAS